MPYRKRQDQHSWHFCEDCLDWPESDFSERFSRPRAEDLCEHCHSIEKTAAEELKAYLEDRSLHS